MAFFGAAAAAFAAFLAIVALKIKRGNLKNAKVTQDKLLEQYIMIYVHVQLESTKRIHETAYMSEDHTWALKVSIGRTPILPPPTLEPKNLNLL